MFTPCHFYHFFAVFLHVLITCNVVHRQTRERRGCNSYSSKQKSFRISPLSSLLKKRRSESPLGLVHTRVTTWIIPKIYHFTDQTVWSWHSKRYDTLFGSREFCNIWGSPSLVVWSFCSQAENEAGSYQAEDNVYIILWGLWLSSQVELGWSILAASALTLTVQLLSRCQSPADDKYWLALLLAKCSYLAISLNIQTTLNTFIAPMTWQHPQHKNHQVTRLQDS